MSRTADIGQLLALRSLREERAQAAVAAAAGRLQEAVRAVSETAIALEVHDRETGERERRFFEAMHGRPVPEGEMGRTRDVLHMSDHRRETLIEAKHHAARMVEEFRQQLETLRAEWCQRLVEREKLAEAHRRLRIAGIHRSEAIAEQDADETSADRARLAC